MIIERNDKKYVLIKDIVSYVETLVKEGNSIIKAYKVTPVFAYLVIKPESFKVYIENGNVEIEEYAYPGEVVGKRATLDGKLFYDAYGHINQWKMDKDYFLAKYDIKEISETETLCYPLKNESLFVRVPENIAIHLYVGEDNDAVPQTIDKGGFLNITYIDSVYGIAEKEFYDTYQVL